MTSTLSLHWWPVIFDKRLAALRKQRTMTQQAWAVAPAVKVASKAAPAKRVAHAGGGR